MKPYQYYIDDILGAVYSPETADPDFLRDSAAMYAEACAEVNDRLRNVARLINRGLRSEAIQLAEQEPNLLDTFGLLDFPELPSWREMLVNWSMAEPPKLLVELASDLNRAYAEHQPIETLLRRHRLLALSRAPLAVRTKHLRKLVAADPGNDAWQADLELLESARIKQIDGELKTAVRLGNLPQLTALYAETKNGDWSSPLPDGLAQKIEGHYRQAAAVAARQELEQLDQRLNAAHMAFDVVEGRRVRDEWLKILPVAMLEPNDPLVVQSQPSLAWLAETDRLDEKERQFETAVGQLERAVDESSDTNVLRRLYNTATSFDFELPAVLKHRVEQRLAAHNLALNRRRRLLIGSLVTLLLCMLAGFGYWMFEKSRTHAIEEAAATLQQMIVKDDLPSASDYYSKLPEYVSVAPAVIKQKSDLDARINAEEQRQADYAVALNILESSPRETPDTEALANVKKLAKLADELQAAAVIEDEIAEAKRQEQTRQTKLLSEVLEKLRQRLQQAEVANGPDEVTLSLLTALRKEILEAKSQHPQANANIASQLTPLVTRLDVLVSAAKERLRQVEYVDRLTESVGNVDAYWRNAEQLATQFPNSAIATTISDLKQEKALLVGLLAWDEFLTTYFTGQRYVTSAQAQAILKTGAGLQAAHANLPLEQMLIDRKHFLASAGERKTEGAADLKEIERLLRDPLIANLFMVTRKSDGKSFYSRSEPADDATGRNLDINYITGFDLSTKMRKVALDDVTYRDRAPQSLLANEIRVILATIPERGWEEAFCKAINATADPRRPLDPILRMILLQRLLETAAAGSTPLAEGFKAYQDTITQANVDLSVPWMAPDDDLAATERKRAEVLISNLPPVNEAIQATAKTYKPLIAPYEGGYQWVGWLTQGTDALWTCQLKDRLSGDGKLFIIHLEPGKSVATISEVGKVQEGKVVGPMILTPTQKVAGRPVLYKANRKSSD